MIIDALTSRDMLGKNSRLRLRATRVQEDARNVSQMWAKRNLRRNYRHFHNLLP